VLDLVGVDCGFDAPSDVHNDASTITIQTFPMIIYILQPPSGWIHSELFVSCNSYQYNTLTACMIACLGLS